MKVSCPGRVRCDIWGCEWIERQIQTFCFSWLILFSFLAIGLDSFDWCVCVWAFEWSNFKKEISLYSLKLKTIWCQCDWCTLCCQVESDLSSLRPVRWTNKKCLNLKSLHLSPMEATVFRTSDVLQITHFTQNQQVSFCNILSKNSLFFSTQSLAFYWTTFYNLNEFTTDS